MCCELTCRSRRSLEQAQLRRHTHDGQSQSLCVQATHSYRWPTAPGLLASPPQSSAATHSHRKNEYYRRAGVINANIGTCGTDGPTNQDRVGFLPAKTYFCRGSGKNLVVATFCRFLPKKNCPKTINACLQHISHCVYLWHNMNSNVIISAVYSNGVIVIIWYAFLFVWMTSSMKNTIPPWYKITI